MKIIRSLKKYIADLLSPEIGKTFAQRAVNVLLVYIIFLNVMAVILETIDSIYYAFYDFFYFFDQVSIFIFSVEYLLRIWTADQKSPQIPAWKARMSYIFSFRGLVDLFVIFPYFLPFVHSDTRFLLLLRLSRVVSLFKMSRYRYSRASLVLSKVINNKKQELLLVLFVSFVLIIIASCIMYFVEHEAQPEVFSSIPATMWWAVTTFTTIGYGDAVPITYLGKFVASILAVVGMGMFALPAGIMASGFSSVIREEQKKKEGFLEKCPHCGREIKQDSHLK